MNGFRPGPRSSATISLSSGKRRAHRVALFTLPVLLAGCAFGRPLTPEQDLLHGVRFHGDPSVPVVALTFDDGPNGACTAAVLDALADVAAPATFFVLGTNVATGDNDAVIARMAREGHEIGLHGWNHEGRIFVFGNSLRRELRQTQTSLEQVFARTGTTPGRRPRFFRPPFGFLTAETADAATANGYSIVLWTVSVGDWRRGSTATSITEAIVSRAGSGDVIVLHDGYRNRQVSRTTCTDRPVVAEVVRLLVPRLRERGLRIAPLGEVLGLDVTAPFARR